LHSIPFLLPEPSPALPGHTTNILLASRTSLKKTHQSKVVVEVILSFFLATCCFLFLFLGYFVHQDIVGTFRIKKVLSLRREDAARLCFFEKQQRATAI